MFPLIEYEINKLPLTDAQKEYLFTALNIAYDRGKQDGIGKSINIIKSSEQEDQEAVK